MAKKNTKKDTTSKKAQKEVKKKVNEKPILNDAIDEIVEVEEIEWVEPSNNEELKEVVIPFMQVINENENIEGSNGETVETTITASTEVVEEEKPKKYYNPYESSGKYDEIPLIPNSPFKKNTKKIRLNFED